MENKVVTNRIEITVIVSNDDSKWTGHVLYLWYVVQHTINFFKANKGVWWMPRVYEAMKDVVSCDKPGGTAHKYYIPGFPNGTT